MTTENNTLDLLEENPQEGVFKFEPIKGYPMLNWKGKRPFTSTRYYPAQLKEQHGEAVNGWLNKIFWGDNLQVMSHLLREFRGKVDLIYIDPPFDSKAEYKKKIQLKSQQLFSDVNSFEEKQYSDIWDNDSYLQFMYERLVLMRELLSETGSIFVHCDWHKSHHIRCMMDEVFGDGGGDGKSEGFKNEIIWHYKTGGTSSTYFARKHDTIFFYSKRSKYKYINNKDISIVDTSKGYNPNTEHFFDENGNRCVYTNPIDVWDIQAINAHDLTTRNGYPTQKPIELIEKIIKSTTEENDLVFDCFLGSGTTAEAASKLNRRFIVGDINLTSIELSKKRLLKYLNNGCGFEVHNVNHYDLFKNPIHAKELLIQALEIQPIKNSIYDGEKDGRMVKLMPVNHIATRQDVNELIHSVDYKAFEKRKEEKPNQPVEKITIYCMGHEPDLAAFVEQSIGYKLDIEVVDILRDRSDLQFKRDSEALFKAENGQLIVDKFYPMNLLQKLSQTKDTVSDWREMVESIMIDWNYDGAVFQPTLTDIPAKNELVQGKYKIPEDAGTIRIKITDLLSESLERDLTEEELANG